MEGIVKFFQENAGVITSVLGFVMMFVAKAAPNSGAGPVVSKVQSLVDALAKIVSGVGTVLAAISKILGDLIKSDGFLGKK